MSVVITGEISEFFAGETKTFTFNLKNSAGTAYDISSDTSVTVTIKEAKTDADPGLLQADADIASDGANGNAIFTLSKTDTAITTGVHFIDVRWTTAAGKEYIIYSSDVKVKQAISDS